MRCFAFKVTPVHRGTRRCIDETRVHSTREFNIAASDRRVDGITCRYCCRHRARDNDNTSRNLINPSPGLLAILAREYRGQSSSALIDREESREGRRRGAATRHDALSQCKHGISTSRSSRSINHCLHRAIS